MKYPGKGASKEQWRKYMASIRPKRCAKKRKKSSSLGRAAARYRRKTGKPFFNPRPKLYIITAKGTGPKMHYDGTKFSQRERVVTFGSKDAAYKKAVSLLNAFPVLKRYTLAVESNFR